VTDTNNVVVFEADITVYISERPAGKKDSIDDHVIFLFYGIEMRSTLIELERSILEEVIDLEAQNMLPVLAAVGIHLTREDIKAEILKDTVQFFVLTFEGKKISALLRYKHEPDHIFIKSIQLRNQSRRFSFLKGLLKESLEHLQGESQERIESVVQRGNLSSIRFHEKLGFNRMNENPKTIRFVADRNDLVMRINKILHR